MAPYSDPERQRQAQREWLAKRRTSWLADKSCAQCGGTEALQIDHIDRTTKADALKGKKTAHLWSMSEERRSLELTKCQVLCADCHLAKTVAERASDRQHGQTLYKLGCRCDVCRASQAERMARYRASKSMPQGLA